MYVKEHGNLRVCDVCIMHTFLNVHRYVCTLLCNETWTYRGNIHEKITCICKNSGPYCDFVSARYMCVVRMLQTFLHRNMALRKHICASETEQDVTCIYAMHVHLVLRVFPTFCFAYVLVHVVYTCAYLQAREFLRSCFIRFVDIHGVPFS